MYRGVVAAVLLVCWVGGCTQPELADSTYPPDFSLVFTVQPGRYASPEDVTQAPAQYVVESNRTLRVSLGLGVHHGLYPPTTATVHHREMAELHAIVAEHALMEAANTTEPAGDPTYDIELTVDGDTHRYQTTPSGSPGSVALLRRLAAMHGG